MSSKGRSVVAAAGREPIAGSENSILSVLCVNHVEKYRFYSIFTVFKISAL